GTQTWTTFRSLRAMRQQPPGLMRMIQWINGPQCEPPRMKLQRSSTKVGAPRTNEGNRRRSLVETRNKAGRRFAKRVARTGQIRQYLPETQTLSLVSWQISETLTP